MSAASITAMIPCFNMAAFLPEAIASVKAQWRAVEEIVVVDDASTDGSADVAASHGARVIRLPRNAGNAVARNAGLAEVRTELIAFLDADDWWYPDHCAVLGDLLDTYPEACAAFGALDVYDAPVGEPAIHNPGVPEGPPRDVFDLCVSAWIGQPTGCVVRTAAMRACGGCNPDLPMATDFDLWLRLAEIGPMVASHRRTAAYRRHAAQLSSRKTEQLVWCYVGRDLAWQRAAAKHDTARCERIASITRDVWSHDLASTWHSRDLARFRRFIALEPTIRGGHATAARWRRRAMLPAWLLGITDRVRAATSMREPRR